MDLLQGLTLPQAIVIGIALICWTVFVIARAWSRD